MEATMFPSYLTCNNHISMRKNCDLLSDLLIFCGLTHMPFVKVYFVLLD